MTHYPYRPLVLTTSTAPEFSTVIMDQLVSIWKECTHTKAELMTEYFDEYFKVLTYYSSNHLTCVAIRSRVDDGNSSCLLNCKLSDRVAALVFNTGLVTSDGTRVFIIARAQPSHWFNGQAMGDICTSKHTVYTSQDFSTGDYLSKMWYVSDVVQVPAGRDLKWNYCTIISSSLPVRPPGPGIDVPSVPVSLTVAAGLKIPKALSRSLKQRVDLGSSTPVFHWNKDTLIAALLVHVLIADTCYYVLVLESEIIATITATHSAVATMVAGYY